MCGIIGYIGNKTNKEEFVMNSLKYLEYRGYDSMGVAVNEGGNIRVVKKSGDYDVFHAFTVDAEFSFEGNSAMGHSRWATHGGVTDYNAHPHRSMNGKITMIHNGIIENYKEIKQFLASHGKTEYASETDTEVLVNLIEYVYEQDGIESIFEAVRLALKEVVGAYSIVVMCTDFPDTLVAAKLSSPLTIGLGEDEIFVASDQIPILKYTNRIIHLEDNEIANLDLKTGLRIRTLDNNEGTSSMVEIDTDAELDISKDGYDYYMHKEIYEQPYTIGETMKGRLRPDEGVVTLGGLTEHIDRFLNARRIIIVSCGTSWHAGLIGEYLIESLAGIPVEVEYASEFRYRTPVIFDDDVVIAISQSGETADTLAAIKMAREKRAFCYGICNVVGTSIPRATHSGSYTHAGPEVGVASTKAFTSQVAILVMMALQLGRKKDFIDDTTFRRTLHELHRIPAKIREVLSQSNVEKIKEIAAQFTESTNSLYLGRGYNFPIALEGALKLKEISYIHAEGYPAAEMKHGPIALIDESMPVFIVAPKDATYEKIVSNVQEVSSRKGKVILIINEGDEELKGIADHYIEIPETEDCLYPFLTVIPLQFISYYLAVFRGCNVDKPRNLAKSVTVE